MVLTQVSTNSYIQGFFGEKPHLRPANDPSMKRGAFTAKFAGVKRKNSLFTIYLILFINKQRLKLNTGVKMESKYWDNKNRTVKNNHPQGSDLNLFLRQLLSKANDIAVRYRLESIQLTKELFLQEWQDPLARLSFMKFYEAELHDRYNRGEIGKTTYKHHKTTLIKLKKFKAEILFSDINLDLVYSFEGFLRNRLNNGPTPINSAMKDFKAYINRAKQKGLKVNSPFDKGLYKVSRSNQRITWLTREEVQRLEEYYHSSFIPDRFKHVLQSFLFACYTGLRFSDIQRITPGNITPEGTLKFTPHKTRKFEKVVEVPLIDRAQKYMSSDGRKIFDHIISEQVTNRYLKEIASICNVKKRITTHVARHTFGSLYIQSGGKVTTLQQLLGHSNIQDTMIYVHIHNKDKQEEMEQFQQFQSTKKGSR